MLENVDIRGKSDKEKAVEVVAYLTGEDLQFYYENFTCYIEPTEEAKSFRIVKNRMLERFSTKKSEAKVMKKAVNLKYEGGDVKVFLNKADKL